MSDKFPSRTLLLRIRLFRDMAIGVGALALGFSAVYVALPGHKAAAAITDSSKSVKALTDSAKLLVEVSNKQIAANGSESHRVLNEVGLTAMQMRKAATFQTNFWDQKAPELFSKSEVVLDRVNGLVSSSSILVSGINDDSKQITASVVDLSNTTKPAIQSAGKAFDSAAITLDAAGKVIGDPHIPMLVADAATTMHSVSGIAEHGNHIMGNVDQKIDTALHPSFWGKIESYTLFGLDLTQKVLEGRYYMLPTQITIKK